MLRAANVCFSYGSKQVIHEFSVSIQPGELVGLVGPNGSGKSTLLRCLAGLLEYSGNISYGEDDLRQLSARQKAQRRSFVGQQVAANFSYRVMDVVLMGLAHQQRFFSVPARAARALEILRDVGFHADPEHPYTALSGGERQQVLNARALIGTPELYLLDEPTSALDLRYRADLLRVLQERTAQGAGVLIALHDLNLAAQMCSNIFLLREGRLETQGTPRQVLTPKTLSAIYGTPVVCVDHPTLDVPLVALAHGAQ